MRRDDSTGPGPKRTANKPAVLFRFTVPVTSRYEGVLISSFLSRSGVGHVEKTLPMANERFDACSRSRSCRCASARRSSRSKKAFMCSLMSPV